MRHIISRDSLVNILGECPRRPIQRAVLTGDVECLGFFSRLTPDDPRPAWMFEVNGMKRSWNVAAVMKARGQVGFRILKNVPWQYWNSDNEDGLKAGDNPATYDMCRAVAITDIKKVLDETVPQDL